MIFNIPSNFDHSMILYYSITSCFSAIHSCQTLKYSCQLRAIEAIGDFTGTYCQPRTHQLAHLTTPNILKVIEGRFFIWSFAQNLCNIFYCCFEALTHVKAKILLKGYWPQMTRTGHLDLPWLLLHTKA